MFCNVGLASGRNLPQVTPRVRMETPGIVLSTLNFMAACLSACVTSLACVSGREGDIWPSRLSSPPSSSSPRGCHSPQVWGGGLEPGPKGWAGGRSRQEVSLGEDGHLYRLPLWLFWEVALPSVPGPLPFRCQVLPNHRAGCLYHIHPPWAPRARPINNP